MEEKYSVLMPLYFKDNPEWFVLAFDSIVNQSLTPDEIVIVCDGPISEQLQNLLDSYKIRYPSILKVYYFEQNRGLGLTLADGINFCKNEYIARMDADDYSVPNRCEIQVNILNENPDLDLVGSNVDEFIDSIGNPVAKVRLPEKQEDIYNFAKRRCPIRHPTLMYKKSKVLQAGNYRDYRHAQDYNLIVHMLLNGCKMYNYQDVLVYMRVSQDFYKRRGGWKQCKLILRLKKEFYNYGFYSFSDFVISGIGNALVCLMPNKLRGLFYKKVLRK